MLVLFSCFCLNNEVWARKNDDVNVSMQQQKKTCSGVVKDSNGETVPGASVLVKGVATPLGTTTGIDGDFTIDNVPVGSTLVVSFIGYQTQEVKWGGAAYSCNS